MICATWPRPVQLRPVRFLSPVREKNESAWRETVAAERLARGTSLIQDPSGRFLLLVEADRTIDDLAQGLHGLEALTNRQDPDGEQPQERSVATFPELIAAGHRTVRDAEPTHGRPEHKTRVARGRQGGGHVRV